MKNQIFTSFFALLLCFAAAPLAAQITTSGINGNSTSATKLNTGLTLPGLQKANRGNENNQPTARTERRRTTQYPRTDRTRRTDRNTRTDRDRRTSNRRAECPAPGRRDSRTSQSTRTQRDRAGYPRTDRQRKGDTYPRTDRQRKGDVNPRTQRQRGGDVEYRTRREQNGCTCGADRHDDGRTHGSTCNRYEKGKKANGWRRADHPGKGHAKGRKG